MYLDFFCAPIWRADLFLWFFFHSPHPPLDPMTMTLGVLGIKKKNKKKPPDPGQNILVGGCTTAIQAPVICVQAKKN